MADLTKLKSLLSRINNISNVEKTDDAYYQANEIATELCEELPDNKNIQLDIKILKKYDLKGSDKSKRSVIEEFKEISMRDVFRVITMIENNHLNQH